MRIVVCGGGISGLTAAYYASKALSRFTSKHFKIIVVERSSNVGGWMQTNIKNGDRKVYDGPINELGPRSVRVAGIAGNNTLQLMTALGLEDDIIPVKSSDVVAKNRLIYVNKTLHALPNSLSSMFQTQPPLTKSLVRSIVPGLVKKIPSSFESMHEVCSARFGDEVANYLVDSFTRGVFAADARHLSMKAAFPVMWKKLKPKSGTLPRRPDLSSAEIYNKMLMTYPLVKRAKQEKWTQWGMTKGFSYLTESLAKHLNEKFNVEIMRNSEVEGIRLQENGKLSLKYSKIGTSNDLPGMNEIENIDHLVSALPSHSFAKVLRSANTVGSPTVDKKILSTLGVMLSHIRSVDVAVVNVEFEGRPSENLPKLAFGHLVPSVEPSKVLGIIYDSCAFPRHDRVGRPTTRLTCMLGGSWFRELFGDPQTVKTETLEQAALESIAEQLKITKDPLQVTTTLCRKCIPMYKVGHTDQVEDIEDYIEANGLPISLAGSSYWGVSINDCIYTSRIAINHLLIKYDLLR
ncbi:protoporphyrinogen oxidase-like [Clavelina lepadiformis]|uniref:Protoporphyrinogen oxidase n=1 Tax=Clavelina lepadiformis TaxID=159417 RepID=A0ABP0GIW2_CLALP